ncbi:MAG: aspartyl protease [Phycisphaerae bacterium]|nr:aspartyl protease [Phycisphaerae bacterium]
MGLTKVTVRVKADPDAEQFFDAEFLVDSGALYTVAPEASLAAIGIKPREERTFTLANGEKIVRRVGFACFEAVGQSGPAKVIFGRPGDSNLLGATTLEALEVALDPVRRELKPLPMLLM